MYRPLKILRSRTRWSILTYLLFFCTCAPVPGPSETLTDDFSSEVPGRWEVVRGAPWKVEDGTFFSTHDKDQYASGMVVCNFPMADGEVEAIVEPASYSAWSVGLVGKYIDGEHHWHLRIVWWQGTIRIMDEKEQQIMLGPYLLADKKKNVIQEKPVHLRVVTLNGHIGIYINGILRSVLDDPFPGQEGRPGLYTESRSLVSSFKATKF